MAQCWCQRDSDVGKRQSRLTQQREQRAFGVNCCWLLRFSIVHCSWRLPLFFSFHHILPPFSLFHTRSSFLPLSSRSTVRFFSQTQPRLAGPYQVCLSLSRNKQYINPSLSSSHTQSPPILSPHPPCLPLLLLVITIVRIPFHVL